MAVPHRSWQWCHGMLCTMLYIFSRPQVESYARCGPQGCCPRAVCCYVQVSIHAPIRVTCSVPFIVAPLPNPNLDRILCRHAPACRSEFSEQRVASKCNRQTQCELEARESLFPDMVGKNATCSGPKSFVARVLCKSGRLGQKCVKEIVPDDRCEGCNEDCYKYEKVNCKKTFTWARKENCDKDDCWYKKYDGGEDCSFRRSCKNGSHSTTSGSNQPPKALTCIS